MCQVIEASEETGLTTLSPHWQRKKEKVEVGMQLDFVWSIKECNVIKGEIKKS